MTMKFKMHLLPKKLFFTLLLIGIFGWASQSLGNDVIDGGIAHKNGNCKEAKYYWQRAADANDPDGEYLLGIIYLNGCGSIEKNYSKAFVLFNKAAPKVGLDLSLIHI